MVKTAVIGGGASGMMAAVCAAECGARVTLYEKNDRVGKKILMTGNGKCNFSNTASGIENYNGNCVDRLPAIFAAFGVEDTVAFFKNAGMLIRDKNGYLYPCSEQASTVLDILRFKLAQAQVELKLEAAVSRIAFDRTKGGFLVTAAGGKRAFDRVILACGGAAAPKTGSDGSGFALAKQLGHPLVDCVPALVQLTCSDGFLKALAGVRCEALLTLVEGAERPGERGKSVQEERGELQFTDYGISGIPVFQLSRRAAYLRRENRELRVIIDLLPGYGKAEYETLCRERIKRRAGKTLEEFLLGMANKKISLTLLRLSGLRPGQMAEEVGEGRLKELLSSYRRLCVHVTGTKPFDNAQVTAGGVDMRKVDDTLESLCVPGLYFAGEILDVDGRCGGYNLQWAWTSGCVAGRNAAKEKIAKENTARENAVMEKRRIRTGGNKKK